MLRHVTMLRAVALLCVTMLVQAIAARTLLEDWASRSVCAGDEVNGGGSSSDDDALAARRAVIAEPAPPRRSRVDATEVSVVPSPAPDEILHVPRLLLA